ncbi:hypothetical protein [Pseudobacteriovorax antillogorgiicola]|uniref:Matrixin n=1 Tax=Pseudobacteriovorax antillogorgiicola TaxID=1513793 RepID=A0A1Y6CAS9_9BACT|nr:hypothetical protein [Pseudobacteriovorax antillogorgiicola]TCS48720.1 hypothetical protein EDD56_117142 [Pseudobacteriovorax antillogorgiicola]SMF54557.1 hypothetical protein SAMN06296036_11717 [Pseudobacteriovorax antillogorgiicola]
MLKSIYCMAAIFVLSACGSNVPVEVQEFKFMIQSDDPAIQETAIALMDQYNEDVGQEVLLLTEYDDEANSFIRFENDLEAQRNILAYGTSIQEMKVSQYPETQSKIVYSMDLLFDTENFASRTGSETDQGSGAWKHLYHLFCHEVGHGLMMNHAQSKESVMYYSIPENSRETVNYKTYFEGVRQFFNIQSHDSGYQPGDDSRLGEEK